MRRKARRATSFAPRAACGSRRLSDDAPGVLAGGFGGLVCSLVGMRRESRDFLLPYGSDSFFARLPGQIAPRGGRAEDAAPVLETLQSLFHTLYDVEGLIRWGGTLLVCIIVFIETGFFVGFFLPGDSLLVTAGVFAAADKLHLWWLLLPVMLCAIIGDQIGYWIGRAAGQALYRREDSFFFRRSHLLRAHDFYEKYGGKTVILARFMPIIRTFCPPVAGAAGMPYVRFLVYDFFGGIFWTSSLILGGYLLGRSVPNIGQRIHYVIAVVILLSVLPGIIGIFRARRSAAAKSSKTPIRAAEGE
jgi:membrane-associated protein